ncbi:MAG: S9 family peptidase [Firmicutes bacterium]|nr:S9 family peptidase [Bacillota bacterium]
MGRKITARDLLALRWVGDPRLSPDGRRLAFVRTQADEIQNGYNSSIWLLDLQDGGEPRRLTYGENKNGTTVEEAPRWSPDGRRLAFTSNRTGKPRIYILDLAGGEARPLTTEEQGAGEVAWSPDGKRLAVVLRDPEKKEGDEAGRAGAAAGADTGAAKAAANGGQDGKKPPKPDVRIITRLRYKFNGVGFIDPDRRRHIHIFDVKTGEARQLTFGGFDEGGIAWSPDGRWIAFVSNHRVDDPHESWSDIFIVPAEGGEPRRLTPSRGPSMAPAFSPDGRFIAYLGHDQGDRVANVDLWIVPVEGGEPRNLTRAFDHTAGNSVGADAKWDHGSSGPVWSADGRTIFVTFTERGNCPIFAVDVQSGDVRRVTPDEPLVVTSFDARGGTIAYVGANPLSPGDIYTMALDGTGLQRRTADNEALFKELELSVPEPFQYVGEGGQLLDAWIMKPVGLKPGEKAPLVLEIHGGPHTAYGNIFFHEFQLLAARGYGVLYTNPRGSTGYGEAFTRGCVGDWGGQDYRDIMAGVDAALERFDWIDRNRLGVTGGSYGGYMTNWIVGHTDRFKAAVTQRSISNLYSMYGTSDIGFHFNRRELGDAEMWDAEERIMERSPIRYARNVVTPLLIIHSDEDHRCPIEQAEQWYIALKRLGKTVEFVRFSGENHELSRSGKPVNRLERLERIVGWFDRFLAASEAEKGEEEAAATRST